jgi:ABC-type phosphate transport system auxiliary subunit
MDYIPLIISLVGTVLTIGVSLWLGIAKQRTENKSAMQNADSAFRDDLLALNERFEKQLNQKEEQIRLRDERLELRNDQLSKAQIVIGSQLEKITDLTLTVKQLQYEVASLREELNRFNKKVFYVSSEEK